MILNKKVSILAGVVVIVLSGGVAIIQSKQASTSIKTVTTTPKVATVSGYTMSDVAKHSSSSSCWSVVDGKVYDLTSWISRHPGGSEAILSMCGIDASSAFNDQHGGQRRPANELAGFSIGTLTR